LAGRLEVLPPGNPYTGQAQVVLGLLLVAKGKATLAESLLSEAVAILRDKADQEHWVIQAEVARGTALVTLGRYSEGEPLLARAWPRFVASRRVPPWQMFQSAEVLDTVYDRVGKTAEAAAWRGKVAALPK